MIAHASRALTPVERRYSQTEKEAISIVWGTEHFHMYLYRKSFNLITDHKPLEVIYCFKVIYKPGKDNPADFMSRHPTTVSVKETLQMSM